MKLRQLLLLLVALFLLASVLLAGVATDRANRERAETEIRAHAQASLDLQHGKLIRQIGEHAALVRGLMAAISINPKLDQATLDHVMPSLLAGSSQVRSVAVAPDMVIRLVYPLQGNEKAVGLNYRNNPAQAEAAFRARDTRQTVLAGPLQLVEGGTALVLRQPVFLTDPQGKESFWGLVAIVIDSDAFLRAAGLHEENNEIEFALRGRNGKGEQGEIILGRPELFATQPLTLTVTVPGGNWQLAALPRKGWAALPDNAWWLRGGFVALALLLATSYALLARAWSRREDAIEQARLVSDRLAATLETAPSVAVQWFDRDGSVAYWNHASELIFGWQREEALGRKLNELILDGAQYARFVEGGKGLAQSGGIDGPFELEVRHRDGSVRHIEVVLFPIQGQQETLIASLGVDITRRVEAQASLRESEARYRGIVDTSPDVIWEVDQERRYTFVSSRVLNILGYLPEEMLGHRYDHFMRPQEAERVISEFVGHMGHFHEFHGYESEHQHKSGRFVTIESAGTPIFGADGTFCGYRGINRDISERKQAAEQVAEREKRLREVMAVIREGIWDWHIDSGVVKHNSNWYEILGYQEGDLGETIESFERCLHPDDINTVRERLQFLLSGKSSSYHSEHRMLCRDGSVIWVQDRGAIVERDSESMPVRCIGSFADITEQVNARNALIEHRALLEQRVSERTAELARARDEAERLARVKSEFLANMSHEIRTPMNAVLGLAQVGQRESKDDKQYRLFGQMLESGQLLLGIINDILDFSKIEAGKLAIEAEPINLQRLIDHAWLMVSTRAAEKGLKARLELAEDVSPWFESDFLRLSQVLGNLLSNAVKFTAQGEVVLAISRRGQRLQFVVSDTGIGMTPEQVAQIFTPFEQADTSITRRFGGTGLGLAISKRLIELMHGEIRVLSTPGAGSRFELDLPLREIAAPTNSDDLQTGQFGAGDTATSQRLHGYRILAAEDNPVNQLVLEDMLRLEGAEVVFADDGLQALDRLQQEGAAAFDLVLTDIQMPRMDGHQLACRLRELYPALPVIGLTAHAMAEERERCIASGMRERVTKPVDFNALVAAIHRHATPGRAVAEVTAAAPQTDDPQTSAGTETGSRADTQLDGVIDLPALLERFQGRQAFVDKIIATALSSQADTSDRLRASAADADMEAIASLAHSLKGMAGNLKAAPLQSLAAHTEELARRGEASAASSALELAQALDALFAELKRLMKAKPLG